MWRLRLTFDEICCLDFSGLLMGYFGSFALENAFRGFNWRFETDDFLLWLSFNWFLEDTGENDFVGEFYCEKWADDSNCTPWTKVFVLLAFRGTILLISAFISVMKQDFLLTLLRNVVLFGIISVSWTSSWDTDL